MRWTTRAPRPSSIRALAYCTVPRSNACSKSVADRTPKTSEPEWGAYSISVWVTVLPSRTRCLPGMQPQLDTCSPKTHACRRRMQVSRRCSNEHDLSGLLGRQEPTCPGTYLHTRRMQSTGNARHLAHWRGIGKGHRPCAQSCRSQRHSWQDPSQSTGTR